MGDICVDARVVRCAPVAFGGWQAGLEFLPRTAAERDALIAWRDSVAAASGDREDGRRVQSAPLLRLAELE